MVKRFFPDNFPIIEADRLALADQADKVEPWKPRPLAVHQWPPYYAAVYAWRMEQLNRLRESDVFLRAAKAYYRERPVEFVTHWIDTYDPRKLENKWKPFVFFERQAELIQFFHELRQTGENGLVEKCRDAGVTWGACAYSLHGFLFIANDAIGWGSRKQDLVDRIGEPDSIFEKMRLALRRLPVEFLPVGFDWTRHATFMKFINPEIGATIAGEAGDNIGRGGRKSIYFKDESAHYERPEKVEAALGDNTNTQIDISSVNGLGNVFHRRREAGVNWRPNIHIETGFTRVFVFDWHDHPEKTEDWYQRRKAKAEREGMQHVFAQEVDRNYSAALQNTIIPQEWLNACIDAHLKWKWRDSKGVVHIGFPEKLVPNTWIAGLDVADGGIDRNALALRQWIILRDVEEWGERDVGVTARRSAHRCRVFPGIKVMYDSIGVGSGIKSEWNRLIEEGVLIRSEIEFVPWNASAGVLDPFEHIISGDEESPINKDFFQNLKAQAWWSVRTRAYKTWRSVVHGDVYPVDELISLDSRMPLLHQVIKELAQPTEKQSASALKTMVDKKPKGSKSPNLGDAVIEAFFPVTNDDATVQVGGYGG